jgi:hypothetical protein
VDMDLTGILDLFPDLQILNYGSGPGFINDLKKF